MRNPNTPLPNIKICVHKLHESNGNRQIVANAYRTDNPKSFSFQIAIEETKYLDLNECLKRVWFNLSLFANFSGIKMEDIDVSSLPVEDQEYIKTCRVSRC